MNEMVFMLILDGSARQSGETWKSQEAKYLCDRASMNSTTVMAQVLDILGIMTVLIGKKSGTFA